MPTLTSVISTAVLCCTLSLPLEGAQVHCHGWSPKNSTLMDVLGDIWERNHGSISIYFTKMIEQTGKEPTFKKKKLKMDGLLELTGEFQPNERSYFKNTRWLLTEE